jgi:hypothetical protein
MATAWISPGLSGRVGKMIARALKALQKPVREQSCLDSREPPLVCGFKVPCEFFWVGTRPDHRVGEGQKFLDSPTDFVKFFGRCHD